MHVEISYIPVVMHSSLDKSPSSAVAERQSVCSVAATSLQTEVHGKLAGG